MKNKENKMKYVEVKVSDVIESKYNPTIRTDKENIKYKSLKESISRDGLLNPILLARNGKKLVAGHRRLNVFKDLGIKYIPAVINSHITDKNYDEMFVADHKDSMPLTSVQECERYLMGAKCISDKTLKAIKRLERIGGKETIKRIVREKRSPNTYLIGIDFYVGYVKKRGSLKAERQALYWMFNIGRAYQLKTAIKSLADAKIIQDCVENRKPLKIDWLPS
tara:strand:+ start:2208 stop:2873 length:666 start_codon:yes stop_codon:yes gene_type:complete